MEGGRNPPPSLSHHQPYKTNQSIHQSTNPINQSNPNQSNQKRTGCRPALLGTLGARPPPPRKGVRAGAGAGVMRGRGRGRGCCAVAFGVVVRCDVSAVLVGQRQRKCQCRVVPVDATVRPSHPHLPPSLPFPLTHMHKVTIHPSIHPSTSPSLPFRINTHALTNSPW
jgi:hypothetical protein